MVGKLNEPSVNMRLRTAKDADGARATAMPILCSFARFRGLRKNVHGQERGAFPPTTSSARRCLW
jgi:hypothetical protein